MEIFETGIPDLVTTIFNAGGTPILVGGAVRDAVMAGKGSPFDGDVDYNATDYDIEVFGLTLPRLQDALSERGYHWDEVGEHFSVLKVRVSNVGQPIDLSIPRYEKSTGSGHREFEVMTDPNLTFAKAAKRRDFCMNSMGFDMLTGTLLDPWTGRFDIENNIISYIDGSFADDPLRPLRAARFAARFTMDISDGTMELCREMRPLAVSLPAERIWGEIKKAVHECINLGDFFWWIARMGWVDLLPEVSFLMDVPQDPNWHPEGDVLMHTCHALNYWSQNLRTGNKEDDFITAIAVLCHDVGKATTTEHVDGRFRARGHEEAGVELTESFLYRLRQYELADEVTPLVANHLAPVRPFTKKGIRRLSTKVKRMDLLCLVSKADTAGRPPLDPTGSFPAIEEFEQAWRDMDIPRGGPQRLLGGDYLISLGMTPGPAFKVILDAVYEQQINGEVTDVWEAKMCANRLITDLGLFPLKK